MNPDHEEVSGAVSKVQRVRQAANVLGISERTVYRRLRSGKLENLPAETQPAVSVMSNVSEEQIAEVVSSQIKPLLDRFACQNDMTNDKLAVLGQQLTERDAQIRTLLENQQELTATIQKLQGQIYELARLALVQSSAQTEVILKNKEEVGKQEPVLAVKEGKVGRWLRILRGRDGRDTPG